MKNMSCVPSGAQRLPNDYVFDEYRSVKWNRDQVANYNLCYIAEVARLTTRKNKRRKEVFEDIYDAIMCEVGHNLPREKAVLIWEYVYDRGEHLTPEMLIRNLRGQIELIKCLMSRKKCGA
jgi:hypothetical protein